MEDRDGKATCYFFYVTCMLEYKIKHLLSLMPCVIRDFYFPKHLYNRYAIDVSRAVY